jgi:hypothetical protein
MVTVAALRLLAPTASSAIKSAGGTGRSMVQVNSPHPQLT